MTMKRVVGGLGLCAVIAGGAYASTRDPGTVSGWAFFASDTVSPLLRVLDPEVAHDLAIWFASQNLLPRERRPDPPSLSTRVWNRQFANPLGLSAGFDKDAKAVEGLLGLGFGHVEVGSVTPVPQDGNPKPRIFRIPEARAVINRCGFNSEGIVAVARRLGAQHGKLGTAERPEGMKTSRELPGSRGRNGLVGVNLGKNRTTTDAVGDYLQGVHSLAQYADYLVINVSSPNTPGLRKLQNRKQLQDLLKRVLAARDEMQWGRAGPPPLLVKIAPDLSEPDMKDIAQVALALRLDGLIISNTTIERPDHLLGFVHSHQQGGLSGAPLRERSTEVLREMYRLTHGKVPLIGCGGVFSGRDAYEKIRAGASLVQIWTSLTYEGPGVVPRIKAELAELLKADGFESVADAVGADHRTAPPA
eukprot:TRINITY_DN29896_c0_g1_i1.p1 TRINITY_DN29896_c0_g1~~TRINITY_DN29896_c0_g1_i1.p1  ORF type:complete len:417 (-),score=54.29 TRINITY_DN29896_c0_g1_i1:279-1529(-)